jgi:nitric oxide reductase NorD protein
LRRLGRRILGPLGQVGRSLEPAARLLRADPTTARSWLQNVGAVQEALGGDLARAYGDLLFLAAERDVGVAQQLAVLVPDQLARLDPQHRRRFLVALDWTLQRRPQAAVAAASHLAGVLPELDEAGLRSFIREAAELVTDSPEKAASFLRGESDQARQALAELEPGLALADVQRALALYASAHCGEQVSVEPAAVQRDEMGFHPLRAAAGGVAHTDGHRIRLPSRVDHFGDQRDFLIYRVTTALCVGYLEQGSFDLDLDGLEGDWPRRKPGELDLQRFLRGLGNRSLAGDLFQILEDVRVEACIRRDYPGLARDLDLLKGLLPPADPPYRELRPVEQLVAALAAHAWAGAPTEGLEAQLDALAWGSYQQLAAELEALRSPEATVQDTAACLQAAWPGAQALMARAVHAQAREAGGAAARGRRGVAGGSDQPSEEAGWRGLLGRASGGLLRPEGRDAQALALDEQAIDAHQAARDAGQDSSVSQQRERIRGGSRRRADYAEADAWLSAMEGPAGGLVDQDRRVTAPLPPALQDEVEPASLDATQGWVYPEWDATIGDYRPGWVLVRELALRRASGDFVDSVNAGYRPQIQSLRRQFEALRPTELELVRALPHGDSLDLDRVVEALTVRRAGGSPSDRLYMRHERSRRDVAVAFLLDMSSSTNEVVSGGGKRIIQVEKEALVLIAEAVEAIGDRFAIWGFSGYGRDQVAFYTAKSFDQPFDRAAKERIGAMSWKMENRDGAAIRHATRLLARQPARQRLLILLSDGKPLDCGCDRYADSYAQEDTRRALVEARKAGLHPFCITVDPHSRDYLQQMYGAGSYTIIDRVESLPTRIPQIYRRLTR